MAIYDLDAVKEQEENNESTLDNMLEACDCMMGIIEADRVLKIDRNYDFADPKLYSYQSTESLRKEFDKERKSAQLAKTLRNSKTLRYGDTKEIPLYTERRLHAEAIGKELAKRGKSPSKDEKKKAIKETCLTILSVLDEI